MEQKQSKEEKGKKFDFGKIPLDLLPTLSLKEIGKVLAFGKSKYGEWNWLEGMSWSRLVGAAKRHLDSWIEREEEDPETGLSHLAHLGCCVLFLNTYEKLGIGIDDRPVYKKEDINALPREDYTLEYIGEEMLKWGVSSSLVNEILYYSRSFSGIEDLMRMWMLERKDGEEDECSNILDTLQKTVNDCKELQIQ